jgi:AcrR family transcriptional regulator
MTTKDPAASLPESVVGSRTTARAAKTNPAGLATLREVARREFVERGFHAVSIRDLAKEAGLSLSVLYHYYASKQELLYSILNEAIDSFHEIVAAHTRESGSPTDPVRHFLVLIESMIDYRATLRVDSLLFIREMRNLEPEYFDKLNDRQAEAMGLFETVIDECVAAGVFTTPYPADARRTIIAMLNAIPEWYKPRGSMTRKTLVSHYSRLALLIVEYDGDIDTLLAA